MVAFIAATVLMPSAAFAATPLAIPPVALPSCGTEAESGGWIIRDFVSNGTSSETDEAVRPKGVRLGEPCVEAGAIQVPNYVRDLNNGGEFGEGAGPGAGPCLTEGFIHPSSGSPDFNRVRYAEMPPGSCDQIPLNNGDGTPSAAYVTYVSSKPDSTHTRVAVTVHDNPSGSWPAIPYFRLDTMCGIIDGDNFWEPTTGSNYDGGYWVGDGSGDLGSGTTFTLDYLDTCGGLGHTAVTPGGKPTLVISVRQPVTSDSIFSTLFTEGILPSDSGTGGNTIGGEVAATIRIDGDGELNGTAGYYLCSIDAYGANQYQVPMTLAVEYNKDYPETMNSEEDYDDVWYDQLALIGGAECDYLMEIHLSVCTWQTNGPTAYGCFETQWTYGIYTNGTPYEGGTLEENMCQYTVTPSGQCIAILYPDPNAPEASIVCIIEYQDPANPITSIGDFFVGLPPWLGCMFTPQGWDRNNKISNAWEHGAVGELTNAFRESVPNGIACGELAELPLLEGQSMTLDTCTADIAPDTVKGIIGWVFVLGICALIVRRIMWSVGSK